MPKDIDYDSEYRRLFSFPRLIEDLLRGFFASEKWTERLNYDSLESMSGSTVSEALDQRHQDMVWRIKTKDSWMFVIVALEFQKTVDWTMALRFREYSTLLLMQIARERGAGMKLQLPAVVPIVIYNGSEPWRAKSSVRELIAAPDPKLHQYFEERSYELIDMSQQQQQAEAVSDNVMATLICLENAKSMEDMTSAAKGLIPLMKSAHNKELNDVFLKWLKTEYMVERNLSSLSEIIKDIDDLEEVVVKMERWVPLEFKQAYKEGYQEAYKEASAKHSQELQEALAKHSQEKLEDKRNSVIRQSSLKFGIETKQLLTEQLDQFTTSEQLDLALDWVVMCNSLEELIERLHANSNEMH